MGAIAPHAARNFAHLFVVSSRQRSYGRLRMQRLPFGDKVINMEFERDILALGRPEKVKIQLQDVNLPDNNSVYFRAKQKELISQYCAARVFLSETDRPNEDWRHWDRVVPMQCKEPEYSYYKTQMRADLYEAALFFYNSVVDISWAMCYLATEYLCIKNGQTVSIDGISPISVASAQARELENLSQTPTARTNPLRYLKQVCPEFEEAIDLVDGFWNTFAETEVRKKYNYCKHKGKPTYQEIEDLNPSRTWEYIVVNGNTHEIDRMPTAVSDVGYEVSLEESICELRNFDDQVLFPYIEKLITTIEHILQPSEMIDY